VSFYPDEVERIQDAQLVLLGVPPSEIPCMPLQLIYDVLELDAAHRAMKQGKMPGEK
jgi:hypothetical protein